jgi:hypothetical protein
VPAHDRCNLLSVVATRSACWNTLSVQVICRCRSMPLRRTAASSRLREKSPLVATSAIRWCQLARSTSAQFQVTTACQWRLARSGTAGRLTSKIPQRTSAARTEQSLLSRDTDTCRSHRFQRRCGRIAGSGRSARRAGDWPFRTFIGPIGDAFPVATSTVAAVTSLVTQLANRIRQQIRNGSRDHDGQRHATR